MQCYCRIYADRRTDTIFPHCHFHQQECIQNKRYTHDERVYQDDAVPSLKTYYLTPNPGGFIRYKILVEEGDYAYIRVLPGCSIADSNISVGSSGGLTTTYPEDFVLQVSKKELAPNTRYLASTALIGKIITLPVRIRKDYWDNDNTNLQGTLSLGYGFGWKYKIGNNPYRSHYFSTIIYAAGVSQQKYFAIKGKDANNKTLLSDKSDQIAVTYLCMGLAYEYERFNVGLFWGKDKMFGKALRDWVYQDRGWVGIGVGYELFK